MSDRITLSFPKRFLWEAKANEGLALPLLQFPPQPCLSRSASLSLPLHPTPWDQSTCIWGHMSENMDGERAQDRLSPSQKGAGQARDRPEGT